MEPSIVPVKVWSILSVWAWALSAMLKIIAAAQQIVMYAGLPERLFLLIKTAPAPKGFRALLGMIPRKLRVELFWRSLFAEEQGEKMLRDYSTEKGGRHSGLRKTGCAKPVAPNRRFRL
jgi:hypothetical protein